MRLIVHAGLHKSGSTYLQQIMNDNHAALRSRGVWYEEQAGYPAHHHAAWAMLRGDMAPLARMIVDAREAGCHTVILSSEDLEGAIFDHGTAAAIEATALAEGVSAIEWHMCLRDPGETFASLWSQLQYHVFADAPSLLHEAMRDGLVMILDPLRGADGTPFWCFCFDHLRYLTLFAERSAWPLYLHDFRSMAPFPGWAILERAGVLDAIQTLPGEEAKNKRLTDNEVRDGYCARFLEGLPEGVDRQRLSAAIKEHVRRNIAAVPVYAEAVGDHFRPGMEEALARFGYDRVRTEIPLPAAA